MKRLITSGFCVFFLALGVAPVTLAHHAVQAQFDVQEVRTFTGVMTKVELINPHPYFHMDIASPDGQTQSWAIESVALNALRQAGLLKELQVGREYTVEVHPARNGEAVALMVAITLPNGNRLAMRTLDPALARQ
ncbi:MAG TPA: DUF6152 family protein [Gammaproteobacteria bacterium]|nr:DUF6152 family protein [Gammaproteobacteria bacterium]